MVALRKESVDRNLFYSQQGHLAKHVALRKESVDRNCDLEPIKNPEAVSLSARRAWIEIGVGCTGQQSTAWSLSARRAWIEIEFPELYKALSHGRSPQGERG